MRVLGFDHSIRHDEELVARVHPERYRWKVDACDRSEGKSTFQFHLLAVEIRRQMPCVRQVDTTVRSDPKHHASRAGMTAFAELIVDRTENLGWIGSLLRNCPNCTHD